MAIKAQNPDEALTRLVKSRGMSGVIRSLSSSAVESNLNEDYACMLVE